MSAQGPKEEMKVYTRPAAPFKDMFVHDGLMRPLEGTCMRICSPLEVAGGERAFMSTMWSGLAMMTVVLPIKKG